MASTGTVASMDGARKFHTLDALRGVAALVVVVFHAASFVGTQVVWHGYLAVDFFFMLSGFVLTFAYQGRLDSGWGTWAFLKVRFVRLYPLYLLGMGLGLGLRVIDNVLGRPSPTAGAMLTLVITGLLVIPAPVQFFHISAFAFPYNIPAWSLFFEAIANMVHAWFLRRRGWQFVACLTGIAGIVLLAWAVRAGSLDLGPHRTEVLPGIARVLFGYVFGVLLFKCWQTGRFRWRMPSWATSLILVMLLVGLPVSSVRPILYDVAVTLVCFPLLLLLSARSEPPTRWMGRFQVLGVASYAIYVLHMPIMAVYFAVTKRLLKQARFEAWAGWETAVFTGLILAAALVADRFYDRPVRRALRVRCEGR